jgi:DNA mismatch endonuclease (patch repair protein)
MSKMRQVPTEQKSRMMSQVRTKGTAPELALRSALHSAGIRFRLHRKDLPGKPDIVLPKFKYVIFVHGCFWHHHEGCINSKMPKTNIEFWQDKIAANIKRDKSNQVDLEKMGWQVLVVWECDIKKNVNTVVKNAVDEIQRGGW